MFMLKQAHVLKRRSFPALTIFFSSSSNFIDRQIESFLCNSATVTTSESLLKRHALVITSGNSSNIFIASKLISLYACFNQPDASSRVFDSIHQTDVFIWNSVIKSHFSNGDYTSALRFFLEMRLSDTVPNDFTVPMVVSTCAELSLEDFGNCIHGLVLKCGIFANSPAIGSSLVYFYAKCGCLHGASNLFDEMPVRDVVAWTAVIIAHVQNGESEKALEYLIEMHKVCTHNEKPNSRTLEGGFQACGNLGALAVGRCLHGLVMKNGLSCSHIVQSSLLSMYSKCGNPAEAYLSFDDLRDKDLLSWTSVIGLSSRSGYMKECMNSFREMQVHGINPDEIVVSCLINGFGNAMLLLEGKAFHGLIFRQNYTLSYLGYNALLSMYCKFGLLSTAEKLFNRIHEGNEDAWNIMVKSYGKMKCEEKCLELFRQMQYLAIGADCTSLVSAISSCSHLGVARVGKSVHCQAVRRNMDKSISVVNSLIDMYGKIGSLNVAWRMFCETEKDVVTWNTMISYYASQGQSVKAISLFEKMVSENLNPNTATLVTVLVACADLATLEKGEKIHGLISEGGYEINLSVATALINMYAKCGQLKKSKELFDSLEEKDAVCWNVMISGYGTHGEMDAALEIFKKMEESNVKPTKLTFLALLTACAHAGLVEEGKHVFCRMRDYGLDPNLKHYACLVDLLARSGDLGAAEGMVMSMPFVPDGVMWGSLLSSCMMHNEFEMGVRMAKRAIECEPDNDGYYTMLANMNSCVGRWEEAEKAREMMRVRGVGKKVGCSTL